MSTDEEYIQPAAGWVRDQLAQIDAAGGDTSVVGIGGRKVMVVTLRGKRSGKLRRVPLMRVEHDGAYAAIASSGGADEHPAWFHSLVANPEVSVHDGTDVHDGLRVRIAEGDERAAWWERAVEAFPTYAEYQEKTDREIPVVVLDAS